MSINIKDRNSYGDSNVYDLVKFLDRAIRIQDEVNKDDEEKKNQPVYGSTVVNPMGYTLLDVLYDPNQSLCLENDTEVIIYLLLDNNKLLRMGFKKAQLIDNPMVVSFALYPNADKLMLRTGKSNRDGKLVYIYYAGGSKIREIDEYMGFEYRTKLPRIARISDVVTPTSIEQILQRAEEKLLPLDLEDEEELQSDDEQSSSGETGRVRVRCKKED